MARQPAKKEPVFALVYSTLTAANEYAEYQNVGGDLQQVTRSVTVKGGAGLPRRQGLLTPLGVMTEVSESDLEFLEQHKNFQQHVAGGWIKVVKSLRFKADADVVAADLAQRDGGSPLVFADFKEGAQITYGDNVPATNVTNHRRSRPIPGMLLPASPFR